MLAAVVHSDSYLESIKRMLCKAKNNGSTFDSSFEASCCGCCCCWGCSFKSFLKKWDNPGLFLFFVFRYNFNNPNGVFGIRTWGCRKVGADETTVLLRPPKAASNLFLKNGPFPASFSLFSSFQYTVDSKQMFDINKFLLMTGFELRTSGIGSNHSTN